MSKQINIGVGGINRKSKPWIGVGGVVKKVRTVYAGIGGVVKELWKAELPIYTYGIENIALVQGYREGKYVASSITKNVDNIYMQATGGIDADGEPVWCGIEISTNTTIDVTNYKTLYAEVDVPSGGGGSYILGLASDLTISSWVKNTQQTQSGAYTMSLDISSVIGNAFVKVRVHSPDATEKIYVSKIWLE